MSVHVRDTYGIFPGMPFKERPGSLVSLERRTEALRLRQRGVSYPEIAEALGVSVLTASKYVKTALAQLRTDANESAEDVRDQDLARLDAMTAALWPKVEAGVPHVVDRILGIMERRARLLGLDAAPRAPVDETGAVVRQYVGVPVPVVIVTPAEPQQLAAGEPITIDAESVSVEATEPAD